MNLSLMRGNKHGPIHVELNELNEHKEKKEILRFVTAYNPASPNLNYKEMLVRHLDIIQDLNKS